jgi:hypothetical protein
VGHDTAFSEAKRNAVGEFASGGFPEDHAQILYSEAHVGGLRFRLQFYLSIHIRGPNTQIQVYFGSWETRCLSECSGFGMRVTVASRSRNQMPVASKSEGSGSYS